MANEQVLPNALSGAEIKRILHDKLDRLMQSCHLNNNLAYPDGVWYLLRLEVKVKDMGREEGEIKQTEGAVDTQGRVTDPAEFAALEARDAQIEQDIADPTAARIESGQEVPVRVTDKSGKDAIKNVKYARK